MRPLSTLNLGELRISFALLVVLQAIILLFLFEHNFETSMYRLFESLNITNSNRCVSTGLSEVVLDVLSSFQTSLLFAIGAVSLASNSS
jgi:hypothetical protein